MAGRLKVWTVGVFDGPKRPMTDMMAVVDEYLRTEFRFPPLIETVLSVQFDPVPGLTNAHLGAFWNSLGAEWPHVSEAPAIQPEFEQFGNASGFTFFSMPFFSPVPPTRFQIRSQSNERMIQVQNGRLMVNWVGMTGGRYTGFESLLPEFLSVLSGFEHFLGTQSIPGLNANQWEVSYVNRLTKGALWQTPENWAALLGGFMPSRSTHEGLNLESVNGEWHFEITPRRGRLHFNIQHGQSGGTTEPSLFVRLTARGPIQGKNTPADNASAESVEAGLRLGHNVIVDTFTRLTSTAAHLVWEKSL